MAKRSFSYTTYTPTAFADTANFTDALYFGVVQGGSSTQRINILEIYEGGQAGSSTPTFNILSRDSTVGIPSGAPSTALGTGQTDASLDGATAALAAPMIVGATMTTKPQRSSTLHLLNLSFNAFGGIVRWVFAPGEEISVVGNTASLGEVSLSAFTGGTPGLQGGHIVYEPL